MGNIFVIYVYLKLYSKERNKSCKIYYIFLFFLASHTQDKILKSPSSFKVREVVKPDGAVQEAHDPVEAQKTKPCLPLEEH